MTLYLTPHVGGIRRRLPLALEQRNPADPDEVVTQLPDCGVDLIAEAAAAAAAALPALDVSVEARADALDRIASALTSRKGAMARLVARETGKTISDAEGEVARASRLFRFFAGEAMRIVGERFASARPGVVVEVSYAPVGVIGAITPWNFPLAIPAWKIAPALAFGNAVVWKPSEHASASADALMAILAEAGLPPGSVNMILGGGGAGACLVSEPDIDAISFTGSERTGSSIIHGAAKRGVPVQAEMGGVNGLIILADADLDAAADAAVNGAFLAAGQRCTATSRIIVDRSVAKAVGERIVERMMALRVGDPLDRATQVGPLVSRRQKDGVRAAIDDALAAGQRPLTEGRGEAAPACFVDPILFGELEGDAFLMREEVFGPVAGLVLVDGYEEALQALNGVRFGLCGGIFTRSLTYAEHFKRHAQVGMSMINAPTAGVDYHAPFGGLKASSFGPREQGRSAREFFTTTRVAYQNAGAL